MHPLVAAVLLRMAGLDTLVDDAKLEPLDRQAAQPGEPARSEGRPVVSANEAWQAVLTKQPIEDGPDGIAVGALEPFAAQDVAAVQVGRRQRIAEPTVSDAKLTLEVSRPDVVRRGRWSQWRRWQPQRSPPRPSRCNQPFGF